MVKDVFKTKQGKFLDLPKSAGILDDFAIRKNIATREGTIQKTTRDNKDIVNKEYVDDIIITNGEIYYNTTNIGIERGDI